MEFAPWKQSIAEVYTAFQTDVLVGLTDEIAQKRALEHGPNTLPRKGRLTWWKIVLGQFTSVLVGLLVGAAVLAGFFGEAVDMWAIIAIILFNGVLGFFQEYRAESSIEALQKLASPTCKVVRSGNLHDIPSEEIVPGDIVLLEAGDKVPADGRVINTSYLTLDEASLTGESVPVSKTIDQLEGDLLLGDRTNMVFMGTNVVRGKGYALITAIGLKTEIGKIAEGLLGQKREQTPLQKKLDTLGKKLVLLCLIIVAVVFGMGLVRGSNMVDMLLVALSLAVAAIPEGLPAVVTIALSIGVRKMAEKKALVRRLSSVETLGSTNVICTDKTGTLTQNAMTVREIWVDRNFIEVTGSGYEPKGEFSSQTDQLQLALKIGLLCNNANLFQENDHWRITGDPTEGALLVAAAKGGLRKIDVEKAHPVIEEIPFDSDRKMMSVLRNSDRGKTLFTKGAPEVLLNRAKRFLLGGEEKELTQNEKEEIGQANKQMASKAYRVLAVAYQTNDQAPLEEDLVFVGLIAMIDPPRPEVKEAIELCKKAGIKTVMVTGDHRETAIAIGKELGITDGSGVDASEIDKLSDEQLENITVFSRISADHKLRIIQAYQHRGKVTAMTGDGVNDAPAVQAADIGISMGITGTDVTKESADLIILDDNFASIVTAVELGRGIYDNIVKFVSYLLSSNLAEILVIFISILLGLRGPTGEPFIALLPVQLLWINLVTDGFPAVSLAMDSADPKVMERSPRPKSEGILNKRFTLFIICISILVTMGGLGCCFYGLRKSVALAQTMTFTSLIIFQLVRVQMIRYQYNQKLFSNHYLLWALASSFILQLAVVYIPFLQPVFGTVPLNLIEWGIILGSACILWLVGMKVTRLFQNNRT